MKNTLSFLFLMLGAGLLIVSCLPPPTSTVPDSTTTAILSVVPPTRLATATGLASVTPQPTASSTPSFTPAPTPVPISPTLVTICPSDPVVPLEELGLASDLRLLLVPESSEFFWDETNNGLFIVAPDASQPQRLTFFFTEEYINSRYFRTSPNGQWILFQRKARETEIITPWISSLDGQEQRPLTSDKHLEDAIWLDDQTVLLFNGDPYFTEGIVYQVLNPFTLQGEYLSNLPARTSMGIGAQFFQYAGRTYLIYQGGNNDYRLFDIASQKDQLILKWLQEDASPFLDKGIFVLAGNQIVTLVSRSYGFDISRPMSIEELKISHSYSETMQPVMLPQAIMPASETSNFSRNTSAMVIHDDTDNHRFYWFDYHKGIITNYCFAPESDGFRDFSPDGKFAVFTHYELPNPQPIPKTTFIFNLETGYVSQIDGYEFIGWAKANK